MAKLPDHPPTTLQLTLNPTDNDLPELSGIPQNYASGIEHFSL
jgi:hypothetical protein